MKIHAWNGHELVAVTPSRIRDHARAGVYICCLSGPGHSHQNPSDPCGYHLWSYAGKDPVPRINALLQMIRTDVPHVNGKGSHSF
jgi:hypothetical protein